MPKSGTEYQANCNIWSVDFKTGSKEKTAQCAVFLFIGFFLNVSSTGSIVHQQKKAHDAAFFCWLYCVSHAEYWLTVQALLFQDVPQTHERFALNLTHPLARQSDFMPNLFESADFMATQAESASQNFTLFLGQLLQPAIKARGEITVLQQGGWIRNMGIRDGIHNR